MRRLRLILIVVLVVAGVMGGWFYYRYQTLHPSTEDAYIDKPT